ncbi:MAG: hypothetical protein DA330_07025 [Nitrososphaera sp.]|nr:hypothetical protein [Nitrososphaera sp.]
MVTAAMVCKGKCINYKTVSRYAGGSKRCQICDTFIKWNGTRCPCCRFALRNKARTTKKSALPKEESIEVATYV